MFWKFFDFIFGIQDHGVVIEDYLTVEEIRRFNETECSLWEVHQLAIERKRAQNKSAVWIRAMIFIVMLILIIALAVH